MGKKDLGQGCDMLLERGQKIYVATTLLTCYCALGAQVHRICLASGWGAIRVGVVYKTCVKAESNV